ncbi:glutathione S-transferase [Coniochaeta sp. 2T2.1]|nr:glutathione S-transferase [Coniochaeta sp. 2T2.1]
MASQEPELVLYTYFRSSCAARVRTAAALKGIPLRFEYVNLLNGDQTSPLYTSGLNPSATVPTLVANCPDGRHLIRQSIAILEYFEEAYPAPKYTPLLPPANQPLRRAAVRDLVNILCVDIQPKTNLSVIKHLENKYGIAPLGWNQEQMLLGLKAYEALLKETTGKYSVGNEITLADVCLAPAIESALRWQVDLTHTPEIVRVYNNIKGLPAFVEADWRHQADTPANLKC